MILIHGVYHYSKKRLAYRNDYCLRCSSERVAQLVQMFDVAHLFFIPILPLGTRKRWYCYACGNDPHERVSSSKGFKLFTMIMFGLFAAFFWILPTPKPTEQVPILEIRLFMTACFIAALAWYRLSPAPADLYAKLNTVQPLPTDSCYFCNGRLDGDRFCYACKVQRLDLTEAAPRQWIRT